MIQVSLHVFMFAFCSLCLFLLLFDIIFTIKDDNLSQLTQYALTSCVLRRFEPSPSFCWDDLREQKNEYLAQRSMSAQTTVAY